MSAGSLQVLLGSSLVLSLPPAPSLSLSLTLSRPPSLPPFPPSLPPSIALPPSHSFCAAARSPRPASRFPCPATWTSRSSLERRRRPRQLLRRLSLSLFPSPPCCAPPGPRLDPRARQACAASRSPTPAPSTASPRSRRPRSSSTACRQNPRSRPPPPFPLAHCVTKDRRRAPARSAFAYVPKQWRRPARVLVRICA